MISRERVMYLTTEAVLSAFNCDTSAFSGDTTERRTWHALRDFVATCDLAPLDGISEDEIVTRLRRIAVMTGMSILMRAAEEAEA